MIDIYSETVITLNQAARLLPSRPHVSTIYRWFQRGIKGIRLATILIGGKRYTSEEAVERFIFATTAAANGEAAPPPASARREREVAAAESRLAKAGI